MREALEATSGSFREILLNQGEDLRSYYADSPEKGQFGSFADMAHGAFMTAADSFLNQNSARMTPEENERTYRKLEVAKIGIGTIAIFLEINALKCGEKLPGIPFGPHDVARVARNSFDFIPFIIESGSNIGASIVRDWIRPEGDTKQGWDFLGTVVDGKLLKPERLRQFDLVLTDDGRDVKTAPRGLEEAIRVWKEKNAEIDEGVKCPGHLFRNPQTDATYVKELFDAMASYTEVHLYPDFIPVARQVMADQAA